MNAEFNKAYQGLYNGYSSSVTIDQKTDLKKYLGTEMFPYGADRITEQSLLKDLTEAIDNAPGAQFLRPDARYFLLVNFHQLIIKPVLEVLDDTKYSLYRTEFRGFIKDMTADVNTIIDKTQVPINASTISGHAIMETINNIWSQLRTTRIEIWG